MLILDEAALPIIRDHLTLPRPLQALADDLGPLLGGSDGDALRSELEQVDFSAYRARTAWAQAVEQAVPRARQEVPDGPCSRRQQRRRARMRESLRRAQLWVEMGRVLDACRFGDVRVGVEALAVCPRTALATALLPFMFPGGPHLSATWVEGWRAQLVKRARHPALLARWFAPPRVRNALSQFEQGRWLGRLAVRLADVGRLWPSVESTWWLEDAFERALRGWLRACTEEQAGDLLDRFCPAPIYGYRFGAFTRAPDPAAVARGEVRCGRRTLAALRVPETQRDWVPTKVPSRTKSPHWWDGFASTPGLPETLAPSVR